MLQQFMYFNVGLPVVHCGSGRLVRDEPFLHGRRLLDNNVILLGLEGEMKIDVGGNILSLIPDSAIVLPAGVEHCGVTHSVGRLSYLWCHWYNPAPPTYFNEAGAKALAAVLARRTDSEDECPILLPTYWDKVPSDKCALLFSQIIEYGYGTPYLRKTADFAVSMLLSAITQSVVKLLASGELSSPARHTLEAMEWIRINIAEPINPAIVAKTFGYHPDYLTRLFKKLTGMSVSRYISHERIAKAKQLLLHTNMKVYEIALAVGFSDEKYFDRVFAALTGVTPLKYRNSYCISHLNKR